MIIFGSIPNPSFSNFHSRISEPSLISKMVSELHPWSSPPSSCHKTLFPVIFDPPSFLLTHSIITHLWRLAKMEKKPVPFLPPRAPSNKLQWKPTLNPFTFGSIHSSIVSQNPNHKNSLYSSIDVDLSLLEAMEEISEGKFEEAIENLTEAKFPELTHDSTTISMDEENEKAIEEHLSKIPGDANVIRSLVEVKVSAREIDEAIQLLDRLIELHPEEFEWPLLKVDLYGHNGEHELARNGFEDLLKKDPLFTEAYHRSAADLFDVLPQRNIHKLFDAISERGEPKLFAEMPKRDVLNLFAIMLTHLKGMEVAKKAGCLLSYDLNSRLPLWPARQQILGTWKSVELVKVYWPPIICDKCFDAYILAGFDMVIHDGVGVLFVSLNGSASTSFNNSVSIGSFHASKKRIVVVFSAGIGNSRPAVGLWLFALLNNKLEGCNDSTVFFSFLVESLF